MSEFVDPRTEKAIADVRTAHARASGVWVSGADDEADADADAAAEVEALARAVIDHLDAGRWDEAHACAEAGQGLAEAHAKGGLWREYTLLVEEAAEIGRAAS